MAIDDADQVRFGNEVLRPSADRHARAYYLADAARDRWAGLGGGQAAIDVMERDIRAACDAILECFTADTLDELEWFLKGGTSFWPADGQAVHDNADRTAPDPDRPAYTAVMGVSVMDRAIQFLNWLRSGEGSFTDGDRDSTAYLNTVLAASTRGLPMTEAVAGNAINRFGELCADYEANSGQKLNSLLAVAVNPGGEG
jgi:hypothetical protein